MKKRLIEIELRIPAFFIKEGKKIVAYTPALDISTCGDTIEHAKNRFRELIRIYVSELVKMGTLEEILEECGWEKDKKSKDATPNWIPPHIIGHEEFRVPCHV